MLIPLSFLLGWNSESSLDRRLPDLRRRNRLDVHPELADTQNVSHRRTEMLEKGNKKI